MGAVPWWDHSRFWLEEYDQSLKYQSDPFWSKACCASHHIFAANATMPQIHGTSCFVALFFFVS